MRNRLMAGVWRYIVGVPPFLWESQIEKARKKVIRSTRFMTQDHRMVHHFVVRELPRVGSPISKEMVARELLLSLDRTGEILEKLEKHLTFLYRNDQGEVTWAYPVTMETTPHEVTFDTGEQLFAA